MPPPHHLAHPPLLHLHHLALLVSTSFSSKKIYANPSAPIAQPSSCPLTRRSEFSWDYYCCIVNIFRMWYMEFSLLYSIDFNFTCVWNGNIHAYNTYGHEHEQNSYSLSCFCYCYWMWWSLLMFSRRNKSFCKYFSVEFWNLEIE